MKRIDVGTIAGTAILAIIQVLPEMDGIYTPIMKRGQAETIRVSQVNQRYGFGVSQQLQKYAADQFEFLCRCKRAAILWDWIEGTPIDELERRYTTNPFQGSIGYGDIIRIAEGTRFHLRSAHQILAALFPENPSFLAALDEILLRVELGMPASALVLTKLPFSLARGQYLALLGQGCSRVKDVQALSDEVLDACVGTSDAKRLRTYFDLLSEA